MWPVTIAVAALLAWSLLAFGGVYPWAFYPVGVGCVVVLVQGWMRRGHRRTDAVRELAWPFIIVFAAACLQLVPLPSWLLVAVNPGASFVTETNAVVTTGGWLPSSLVPALTAGAVAWCACLFLLFLGLTRITDGRQLWRLGGVVVLLGCVLALLGLAQGDNPLVYGVWQPEGVSLPMGPFVNRNHYAGWLVLAIGLAVAMFCRLLEEREPPVLAGWRGHVLAMGSRESSQMMLVGLALLLMGVALATSLSRSGLLSGGAVLATAGLFSLLRRRDRAASSTRGYVVVLTVLVLAVL